MSKQYILHDPYNCPVECVTFWKDDLEMLAKTVHTSVEELQKLQPGDDAWYDDDYWYMSVH